MKKVLTILLVALAILTLCSCGGGEKIKWSDMILGDVLPEPPSSKGEALFNTTSELFVDVSGISIKEYNDYVEMCKEKGFTIDAELDFSYDAYNSEGYHLTLDHYERNNQMRIQLEAPMELSAIQWPMGTAGNMLPAPKSTTGKFSYEYDDSFFVYVGETSKADYDEYVSVCSEAGFSVDYNKGDDYYRADNANGWHISLNYEGNNVMAIQISPPDKKEDSSRATQSSGEKAESDTSIEPMPDTTPTPETSEPESNADLSQDFKAAMDSYEMIMTEYVDFMKKYNEDPSNTELLLEYADYLSKYTKAVEEFEKWNGKDMSTEEAAYYLDVQGRVTKKLLEIAS